jgi:hypothetical protein
VLLRRGEKIVGPADINSLGIQGTYNGGRLLIGAQNLWVGTSGAILQKNGTPEDNADGRPLGWGVAAYDPASPTAAPIVTNIQFIEILNISNHTITNFVNGFQGQVLTIVLPPSTGTTTIKNNSNIRLISNVDILSSIDKVRAFQLVRRAFIWVQLTAVAETSVP